MLLSIDSQKCYCQLGIEVVIDQCCWCQLTVRVDIDLLGFQWTGKVDIVN